MRIVISLGGSLIVPDDIDYNFLKKFKKTISRMKKGNKIVIVTGGGSVARKYINALRKEKDDEVILSLLGIKATKLNAMLVSNFLNVSKLVPDSIQEVNSKLKMNSVVVCGALGYRADMTTDGTAAEVARYIKADKFINMTDVSGLFDKDPRKYKDAKLIKEISFDEFLKIVNKIEYEAGQHFVLDQYAARLIAKYKIRTVTLKGLSNLENAIKGKKFVGTVIG